MVDVFRRKKQLAADIERLVGVDLDMAAQRLHADARKLRREDAERLAALVRRQLEARDHRTYLSKALAEGAISPSGACELLETYLEAGYVTPQQFDMLRRHAFEAHRREIMALLADPTADRSDYFRAIDGYKAAGYLSQKELDALVRLLDFKLNPGIAARRLFTEACTAVDMGVQEELLHRYLVEFDGFPDHPKAASLYLGLKIHQLWDDLPGVRYAREATRRVRELNNLLEAYLPDTSDLSLDVPIDHIVREFSTLAGDFKPQPDPDEPITERHLNRKVVVVDKLPGARGSYESERNGLVSVGATGRVRAVYGDKVVVAHQGNGLPYSENWHHDEFEGTKYAKTQRNGSLAVWRQCELGLVENSRPSPVFVHQFREAVKTMAALLEKHRQDNPPDADGPKLIEPESGEAS